MIQMTVLSFLAADKKFKCTVDHLKISPLFYVCILGLKQPTQNLVLYSWWSCFLLFCRVDRRIL